MKNYSDMMSGIVEQMVIGKSNQCTRGIALCMVRPCLRISLTPFSSEVLSSKY